MEEGFTPVWARPSPHKSPHFGRRARKRTVWSCVAFTIICALTIVYIGGQAVDGISSSTASVNPAPVHPASKDSAPVSSTPIYRPTTSRPQQRRLTLIATWNSNNAPAYLKHFLYTTQMNADVVDLLLLNRAGPEGECLDLANAGTDLSWASNIKLVCMDFEEWTKWHVDFLCGDDGWSCNETQREEVTREFQSNKDVRNIHWRPLQDYVFRDLFMHRESPYWA